MRLINSTIATVTLLLSSAPVLAGTCGQLLEFTSNDIGDSDFYGSAIARSGIYGVIGAPGENAGATDSGAAYVNDLAGGSSQLFKLVPDDPNFSAGFGGAVDIDGNIAIIGARGDDETALFAGAAYLFDVTTGTQLFKLTASDGAENDWFGYSVAIDGAIAVVGAPFSDNAGENSGAAYVFSVATGQQVAQLTASAVGAGDTFGWSVSIGDEHILVGAPDDTFQQFGAGSVYVFDRITDQHVDTLNSDNPELEESFGASVAIDGDVVAIGATGTNVHAGSAFLFDVSTGTQLHKLFADDGAANDRFGHSIDIRGDNVLVGARLDDDNGEFSGSAYLFDANTGEQVLKFNNDDGSASDIFGDSLTLADSVAHIGAPGNDTGGSAYTFSLNSAVMIDWNLTGVGDWFQAGNWSSGGVPDTCNSVFIDNGGTSVVEVANAFAHEVIVGYANEGALTVLDLGTVTPTTTIELGVLPGSNGTLNIESDTAVGVIDAAEIHGGDGTATLNFNHEGASYFFTRNGAADGPPISITGSTTVNHVGTGSTFLFGPNTYTGGTNVHQGRLDVRDGGSIDHGDVDIVIGDQSGDDASLTIVSGGAVTNAFADIANSAGSHGDAHVTNGGSVWTSTLDLRVGRGGTGSLLITDGGEVNDRTGVIGDFAGSIGTATVSGAGSTWTSSDFFFIGVAGDATLTIVDGGTVDVGGSFRIADAASSTGTLNIGDGSEPGFLVNVFQVVGGDGDATVNFNHNDPDYHFTSDGTASGAVVNIGGSAAVNHIGTGTTTLLGTAFNSHSGPTTIDAGTLRVNGSALSTATTVSAGGTLGGSGSVGAVSVFGGAIAPGSSAGTLSTGALSLDSASVLEFELDGLAGPNDRINVNGDLVLDGTINITNLGGLEEGSYDLINYGIGALTDNGLAIGSAPSGFEFTIDTTQPGSVVLDVVADVACPADISDPTDGMVNVFDLLELLANWGGDGAGSDLAEPNDVVNVFDLLELLAAWGACP